MAQTQPAGMTGKIDLLKVYSKLRQADLVHMLRIALVRERRGDRIEERIDIGPPQTSLDTCWLRITEDGAVAVTADLLPFDPAPAALDALAIGNGNLNNWITTSLRNAPLDGEEREACTAIADRIEQAEIWETRK